MHVLSNIQDFFSQKLLYREWKKSFALQSDYEIMSELAIYIANEIEELRKSNASSVQTFLYGSAEEILRDPHLRLIETDISEDIPQTLEGLISAISSEDFQELRDFTLARLHGKVDLSKIKYIAFAGGGAKGLSYPGVLQALDEIHSDDSGQSLFDQIEEVSGTSAGSLVGLPMAMGYNSNEIKDLVEKNNFGRFFDESNVQKGNPAISWGVRKFMVSEQDQYELDYLEVFSNEILDRIIDTRIRSVYRSFSSSDENYTIRRQEVLASFRSMPYHDVREVCENLIEKESVEDWIESGMARANSVYQSVPVEKRGKIGLQPFSGFDEPIDALIFSIRRANGNDKIQAFLEDVVEEKLNQIPKETLERLLPSVTTDADKALDNNVIKMLQAAWSNEFQRKIGRAPSKPGSKKWKKEIIGLLRSMSKDKIQSLSPEMIGSNLPWAEINDYEIDVAIDAISMMRSEVLLSLGDEVAEKGAPIDFKISDTNKRLKNNAYKKQRTLYKRKLNFKELAVLSEYLPEMGFRKFHVSMCELGDGKDAKKALLKGSPKEAFSTRFKLADASAENNDYADMPVSRAVRHSMNVPFGFRRISYRGARFVDGGLVANLPSHFFNDHVAKEKNATLSCVLTGDDVLKKGRSFKESIKNTYVSGYRLYDYASLLLNAKKSLGVRMKELVARPFGRTINWAIYKLNPNYRNVSHEDMMRTIMVPTGDVAMADFGMDRKRKREFADQAKEKTFHSLVKGEDMQIRFLSERIRSLESEMKDLSSVEEHKEKHRKSVYPGIFSRGDIGRMNKSMKASKEGMKGIKSSISSRSSSSPEASYGM